MKFSSHQAGFSLIETLVAISILLVAIVGPLTIASRGLEGSLYAREQITATFLAQEGVELIVKLRNNAALENIAVDNPDDTLGWDWVENLQISSASCFNVAQQCGVVIDNGGGVDFVSDCSSGDGTACNLLFDSDVRSKYNYGAGNPTSYNRRIYLETIGTDALKIVSTVSWTGGLFGGSSTTVSNVIYDIYD